MKEFFCKYCGQVYESTDPNPAACPLCAACMDDAAAAIAEDAAGRAPEWNGVHFTDGVQMPTREEMREFWQHQRQLDAWAQSLTDEQRKHLCNMGHFNGIMRGYAIRAAQEMGLDDDQTRQLLQCYGYALDMLNADEAEKLYCDC